MTTLRTTRILGLAAAVTLALTSAVALQPAPNTSFDTSFDTSDALPASVGRAATAITGYDRSLVNQADAFFAQFAGHATVVVESHLPRRSRVPLRAAVSYVDRFTASRFVYGRCPADPRAGYCIRVYQGTLANPTWAALTDWQGSTARIVFANRYYNRASFGYRYLYLGAVHELGHTMGIWTHNPSTGSVMYYYLPRAASQFDPADVAVLLRH